MKKHIALIPLLIILSGCATSYQKQGFSGGFEETQIAPNAWRVSFNGNGYTSRSRSEEFALLRSADLAMQNGFNYFILVGSNSDTLVSSITTPITSTTNVTGSTYGNNFNATSNTNSYGGNTILISKPSTTNTVLMFKEKPDNAGIVYDAFFLCLSLAAKYNVQCKTIK
jgi:hypothetical protein